MRFLAALLICVSVSSCTREEKPVPQPPAAPPVAAPEPRKGDPTEARLLAENSRILWREGSVLRLKAMNGTQRAFEDAGGDAASAVETHLAEVYPESKLALLEHRVQDGQTHELVSLATGASAAFVGKPVWSKDRKTFVAVSTARGTNPDQVYISRCSADKCAVLRNDAVPGSSVTWESNSRVKIDHMTCEIGDQRASCTGP